MDKNMSKKVPLTQARYENLRGKGYEIKLKASQRITDIITFIEDTEDDIEDKKAWKKENRKGLSNVSGIKKEQRTIIRRAKKSMRVAKESSSTLEELFFRDPQEIEKAIELTIREARNSEKEIPTSEELLSESLSYHKKEDGSIVKLTPSEFSGEFGKAITSYVSGHLDLAKASHEIATSVFEEKELRTERKKVNSELAIYRINKRNANKELDNQRDIRTSTSFRLGGLAIKHFFAVKLNAKVYVKRDYYRDTRFKYLNPKLLNKNNT